MEVDKGLATPVGLPPVGTLVGGKYLVERYVAEGGMGVIAFGKHVELDEPVALKFLKPEVIKADASVASRFVREARATIKIRSEHVPRIFDVSTLDGGVPFIVMELLVGEDLEKQVEKRGPLPVSQAVDLLLQSLEALAAAHALGMVHRDYKPANLFVATRLDGTTCVKVLDFGIAKLVDRNGTGQDSGLTGTNAVMGSPRYMSPEQMRSSRDVDARADIWAVGTTLYEVLVGAPPFDGESLTQVCAAILQDEPGSITQRRPDVPGALEDVVRRCLAKRATERFANVAELAQALAPFGTAPASYELAARAARVLGTTPSAPALSTATTSLTNESSPSLVSAASSPRLGSSPSLGATNTSWGAANGAAQQSRRRLLTIVTVFAALLLVGLVLGGVALLRSSSRPGAPLVAAATGAPLPALSGATSPPIPADAIPQPVAAAVTASNATAAPSAPAPPSSALAAGPSGLKARPASTVTTGAGVKPASSAKPTSPPPAGGLWDDRK